MKYDTNELCKEILLAFDDYRMNKYKRLEIIRTLGYDEKYYQRIVNLSNDIYEHKLLKSDYLYHLIEGLCEYLDIRIEMYVIGGNDY